MVNNLAVTPVDSIYWLCGFKYTLSLHVNPWKQSQNNCSDCYSVPGTSRSNDQPDLIANNYAYEYMHTCMNEKDTRISSFWFYPQVELGYGYKASSTSVFAKGML